MRLDTLPRAATKCRFLTNSARERAENTHWEGVNYCPLVGHVVFDREKSDKRKKCIIDARIKHKY